GECEVVAHAGAAERYAVYVGLTLEIEQVIIRWNLRITGEVIPGRIEPIDTVRRTVVDHVLERHLPARQRPVERVGIEADFQLRARAPFHFSIGPSRRRPPGQSGRGDRQKSST